MNLFRISHDHGGSADAFELPEWYCFKCHACGLIWPACFNGRNAWKHSSSPSPIWLKACEMTCPCWHCWGQSTRCHLTVQSNCSWTNWPCGHSCYCFESNCCSRSPDSPVSRPRSFCLLGSSSEGTHHYCCWSLCGLCFDSGFHLRLCLKFWEFVFFCVETCFAGKWSHYEQAANLPSFPSAD